MQLVLIGLGAGAASALLFASVASGALISILLFYLAPLPLLIAALGWSHWAALIGALAAAIGLTVALGSYFFFAFLCGVGLPAWWLGYLSLLAQPAAGGEPGALEWYPTGRLLLWAAILGTLVIVSALPTLGFDLETFRGSLRHGFERILHAEQSAAAAGHPNSARTKRLIDILVVVVPPAAAALSTAAILIDLWLAGRVVRLSGRLGRPWPELAETRLPRRSAMALGIAIAACLLPGIVGMLARVLVATLVIVYAVAGLAVLHAITRGMMSRGLLLGGTYAMLLLFGWPLLVMTIVGLADAGLDLRARFARKRGPPPPFT